MAIISEGLDVFSSGRDIREWVFVYPYKEEVLLPGEKEFVQKLGDYIYSEKFLSHLNDLSSKNDLSNRVAIDLAV
jgi:hypothetical protein